MVGEMVQITKLSRLSSVAGTIVLGARGIVPVVCSIVLSKGSESFM